jgi:hypothetical protein
MERPFSFMLGPKELKHRGFLPRIMQPGDSFWDDPPAWLIAILEFLEAEAAEECSLGFI